MIYFCHPAVEKWLLKARVLAKYISSVSICFVSSYPTQQGAPYAGLKKAVKFRLSNSSHPPIIILSFLCKKELMQSDSMGILSLYGTEYLQLPVSVNTLSEAINICKKKYQNNKFLIPVLEWNQFANKAYKQILSESLSQLKHGNQLDFINNVTGPLRAAAVACLFKPEMIFQVKAHLKNVVGFTAKGEISELILMAIGARTTNDSFLSAVSSFSEQLKQFEAYSNYSDVDVKKLIFIIDNLNEAYSRIQSI